MHRVIFEIAYIGLNGSSNLNKIITKSKIYKYLLKKKKSKI